MKDGRKKGKTEGRKDGRKERRNDGRMEGRKKEKEGRKEGRIFNMSAASSSKERGFHSMPWKKGRKDGKGRKVKDRK